MPDYNAPDFLPSDFRQAARPEVPVIQPPKVTVSHLIDADVLAYFQSATQPSNWAGHMNDILRAYMETSMALAADFDAVMRAAPSDPSP